jgi:hypothetical protein
MGFSKVLVVWVCEKLLPYRYLDDQHLVIDSCDHTAARNCNLVFSKGCCYNVSKLRRYSRFWAIFDK